MLFNAGKVVSNNWTNFADLLKSGIKAVRDFSASVLKVCSLMLAVLI